MIEKDERARPRATGVLFFAALLATACHSTGEPNPNEDSTKQSEVVTFEGPYVGFVEQPVGATECGASVYNGTASGALRVGTGAAPTLRFEGYGCTIDVEQPAMGVWTGSDRACRFDGTVTIEDLGVTEISFDRFDLNQGDGTMNASGWMTRQAGAEPVSYCFEIRATLP